MAWYHWLAAYIIIIAGAAFVVLPLTLLFKIILGLVIAGTIWVAGRLPAKEEEYVDREKEPL